MKPIPFDPNIDLPPIPFGKRHLQNAFSMKQRGLVWKPHVGCFVWDREEFIEATSPFPLRTYFILSLPRFISIFGSLEALVDKLVWLPTWHQARLIAMDLGVNQDLISGLWATGIEPSPGDELLGIYRLIMEALQRRSKGT